MTLETYDEATSIVDQIKGVKSVLNMFDSQYYTKFKITAIHNETNLGYVELTGSGAQYLYNALNYTHNKLIKELDEL